MHSHVGNVDKNWVENVAISIEKKEWGLKDKAPDISIKMEEKNSLWQFCHGTKPIGLMKAAWAFSVLSFAIYTLFHLLFIFCNDYESRHLVKWKTCKTQ